MIFVGVSLLVLLVSFLLFRRAYGSLSPLHLTPGTYIFFYQLFLQSFVGSVLIVLHLDDHYVVQRVSDDARFYGWLAVQYVMVATPLGIIAANLVWLRSSSSQQARQAFQQKKSPPVAVDQTVLLIVTLISTLACIYTFSVIGSVPIINLISNEVDNAANQRYLATNEFDGIVYIRNILAITLMPIVCYSWLYLSITNKNIYYYIIFAITLTAGSSILTYNLSKGGVAAFFMGILWVISLAGALKYRHLSTILFIVVSVVLAMYALLGSNLENLISHNSGPVGRMIIGQIAGLFWYLDLFPDSVPHIGLSSISRFLSNLLNQDYVPRAAALAMEAFNPKGVAAGEAGVMNSLFVAEAWANFGLAGVIVSPLIVGFVVQTIYIALLSMKKTSISVGIVAIFSISPPLTGGFNDFMYPVWAMVLLGTAWICTQAAWAGRSPASK